MSQSTNKRSDDGGPGGWKWEMGTDRGKQNKKQLTAPESEETGFPSLAHTWSTRMYDFNTIFENSIEVFFTPLFINVQQETVIVFSDITKEQKVL